MTCATCHAKPYSKWHRVFQLPGTEGVSRLKESTPKVTIHELEKKLTQPTLAQPQDRNQIWNVLEDLLVTTDAEGKYINVNPAWTTVLGWSEAELLGHVPEWLIHPDDLEKTRTELSRLASGQRTLRFENRLRHKNGTYNVFSWVAVHEHDRVYAAGRDITEIKRAEDEIRLSIQEIGQASRQTTMSEMTASIAHEINQPLSAIVTNGHAALRWLGRIDPKSRRSAQGLDSHC